jgi:hypothetical protein
MTIPVSTLTIRAVLSPSGSSRQKSGIADVEISESGTFLKTGSERIRIILPDGVSLNNGQQVRYTVAGETLQLGILPEHPGAKNMLPAGIFTPTTAGAEAISPSGNSAPVTLTTSGLQPGIYLYNSIEAIPLDTGNPLDEKTLSLLTKQLNTEGVIALHITSVSDDGTAKAVLWPAGELPTALKQLVSSFTSNLFSSLSPEQLGAILIDRGNLPFKPLLRLDGLFQSADTTFPPLRAGSTEAQLQSTTQWLHNVLAYNLSADDHLSLAPVTTAGTMMDELEPAMAAALKINNTPPDRFTLSAISVSPEETRSNLLPELTDRIGLTLEHILASDSAPGRGCAPQDSLKSALLHLLNLTHQNISPSTTGTGTSLPSPEIQQKETAAAVPLQALPQHVSSALTTNLTSLRNALPLLIEAEAPLPTRATPVPSGTQVPADQQDAAQRFVALSPLPEPDAAPQVGAPIKEQQATVIGLMKETVHLLDSFTSVTGDRQTASLPQQSISADALQALKESLIALVNRYTTGPAPVQAGIPGDQAALPLPHQVSESLQVLLNKALEVIDSLLRPEITARTHPHSGEIAGAGREQQQIETAISRDSTEGGTVSHQSIARSLGTALDRLESLQLLARQVPTAQGTQQIIALPIKFGDAWTEINVRFLHQKNKKSSGRKKQQTSVAVDVAPPALGAIHATMNYRPTHGLQLSVAFEHSETRTWFVNNREAFHQALLQCGIKSVQVDLQQTHRTVQPEARTAAEDTIIDMKV